MMHVSKDKSYDWKFLMLYIYHGNKTNLVQLHVEIDG